MEINTYLGVIERLEPELTAIDKDPALASIAISLKRIADALDRLNASQPSTHKLLAQSNKPVAHRDSLT